MTVTVTRNKNAAILSYLSRKGPATLAELAEALGVDVKEVWQLLRPLRDSGIVKPPVEYGVRGRKRGGPLKYRVIVRVIRSKHPASRRLHLTARIARQRP